MALLDDIRERVKFLPEKDIVFAHKFIANRDFESLHDIVYSDLQKMEKKQLPNGGFEDQSDAFTYMELSALDGDIIKYLDALGADFSQIFVEDDDDDEDYMNEDEYFY